MVLRMGVWFIAKSGRIEVARLCCWREAPRRRSEERVAQWVFGGQTELLRRDKIPARRYLAMGKVR